MRMNGREGWTGAHVSRAVWCALVAAALALGIGLWPRAVEAETGGHSQVRQIELAWVPGAQGLVARVTLATGQALTWRSSSEQDVRALLDLAGVFAQKDTRMFVEVKGDSIQSFQVSIP